MTMITTKAINRKNPLISLFQMRGFFLVLLIIIGFVVMSFSSSVFLKPENLLTMLMGLTFTCIVAIGMTVVIISKGLDLSVGSIVAMSSMVVAFFLKQGHPIILCILYGFLVGILCGFVNGIIIAKVGVNPFITTLGMQIVLRGLVLLLAGGVGIVGLPARFQALGQSKIVGIQTPIWVMFFLVIVFDLLLRNHIFFRQNYYIGSNEKAAVFSGFQVEKIKIIDYVICGFLAALAGVLLTSRLGGFSTTIGAGMEMNVLTAVIIGGASLNGGEGSIIGTFIGCLLISFIGNALNLLGVSVYWQQVVMGSILLFAVLLDVITGKYKLSLTLKKLKGGS
jgi:ribose transport system permease protein